MDCRELREQISALADGALTPEEQEKLDEHLSGCDACSRFLTLEQSTKRLLRQRLLQPQLPPGLRETIIRGIRGAERTAATRRRSALARFLRPAPILAMAAALALFLGLSIFYGPPRSTEASPFVRDSVDGHVKCLLGEYTMEVELANPDKLARWFQGRLQFPARLPQFARQDQTELWEGRVSLMGGVRSAQVFYRWKGKTLSLFVLPAEKMPLMPGEDRVWNSRTFHVNQHKGHTSLMWREGDLAYCLVSDLPPEEVMAFASEEQAQ
ncbi:MAG: zf-HC2 domain-containing protein [Candidatus Methylomirabilaceae bacterium]